VFFVVGLGKSGTSWLMRTLDGHPEILCRGEGRFFGREWKRSPEPGCSCDAQDNPKSSLERGATLVEGPPSAGLRNVVSCGTRIE
jgi:hypothetical protein